MEFRRWQIYVVINCVIITHLVAKPVSLNELIAAEGKQKQTKQHTKPTGGKTVSLNELIAVESKQNEKKSSVTRPSDRGAKLSAKQNYPAETRQKLEKSRFPKTSTIKTRRKFSLKDLFAAESSPTKRRIESLLSRTPGIFSRRRSIFPSLSRKPFESAEDIFSPLKFRKKFEIKSPLKPKKIKYSFTPRLKRRKESTKREANEDEIFDHKHLPLIKRIGLLVDDILAPDYSESFERTNRRKPRRNKKSNIANNGTDLEPSASEQQKTAIAVTMVPPEITTDTENPTSEAPDTTTPDQLKSTRNKKSINENNGTDLKLYASESQKTAITTTMVPPEITDTEDPTSEAPNTTTYYPPTSDIDTLRPDPHIPLPPARNTGRHRGNDIGVGERSSPTFHRDFEGHITRNNRSDEYNSRGGENQTHPSSNEENSCSSTRINKCRDESRDGNRYPNDFKTKESEIPSYNGVVGRNDIEGENIFQVGRKEEPLQIPRNLRRLPGPVSDKVFIVDAESVSPKKFSEKGFDSVAFNHTSAERGTERNGSAATENQRIRQVIEGVIPMQGLLNPHFINQHGQQSPVVTVFDGYSVARDINGRNELTEKSIRISPY